MKRFIVALAALSMVMAFTPTSAQAFDLNCAYSRSLTDDPIVYQNQPGVSHLHDFFGNKTTDAFSTTNSGDPHSLLGKPTSCQNVKDPSAYWAPASYINGIRVLPKNIKAYYNDEISGPLIPYPTGLRMLAGVSTSTAAQSTSVIYFGCGSGTGISKKNYPPNCTSGNLQIHILFPNCGTGALDSADHRSHMAYSNNGACPAGFSQHYPQLGMRINWDIKDARTLQFSCLLSSGTQCNSMSGSTTLGLAPYWTEHGDFINAWDPSELARLVQSLN